LRGPGGPSRACRGRGSPPSWLVASAALLLFAGCRGDGAQEPAPTATATDASNGTTEAASRGFRLAFDAFYADAAGRDGAALSPTKFVRTPGGSDADGAGGDDPAWPPLPQAVTAEVRAQVPLRDALQAVHAQMQGVGLDPDDVADVAAYHASLNWLMFHQRALSPERVHALRTALLPFVVARLQREGMDAAGMQRMADALAMDAALLGHAFSSLERRGDRAQLQRFRDAVRARYLAATGIDLMGMG